MPFRFIAGGGVAEGDGLRHVGDGVAASAGASLDGCGGIKMAISGANTSSNAVVQKNCVSYL